MPLSLFHLHGDLKDLRFPRLLAALRDDDFTGVFQATTPPAGSTQNEPDGEVTREVHFSAGHIAWAISTDRDESLKAYLIRTGTVTEARWAEAEEAAREGTLRQALINLGVVNARELTQIEKGRAEEIVLTLFSARQGEYRVRERQLSPGTPDLRIDARPLILKGVLEGGDRSLILDEVGSLDTVYVVKRPALEEPGVSLPGEFQSVLRHIDGKRSIAQICSLTSLPDYFVCSVFAALSMIGALRRNYEKSQTRARGEIVKGLEVAEPAPAAGTARAPLPAPGPGPAREPVPAVEARPAQDPGPVPAPGPAVKPGPAQDPGPVPAPGPAVKPGPAARSMADVRPAAEAAPPALPDGPAPELELELDMELESASDADGDPVPAGLPPISKRPFPAEGPSTPLEAAAQDAEADEGIDVVDDARDGGGWRVRAHEDAPASPPSVYSGGATESSRPWFLLGGATAVGAAALFLILMAQNPGDAGEVAQPVPEATAEPWTSDAEPLGADNADATDEPDAADSPAHGASPAPEPPPAPVATSPGSNILKGAPDGGRTTPRSLTGRESLMAGDYVAAARIFGRDASARSGQFTIQLLTACQDETVQRAVERSRGSSDLFILSTRVDGRNCYRVYWGRYPSATRAREALRRDIPSSFVQDRNQPRITRIGG